MKTKTYLLDSIFLLTISFVVFYGSLNIYFLSENISHIETAYHDFRSLVFTNNYFRPLYVISLFVDRAIWGSHYFGYHLTNLLFHTGNVLLVYYLSRQIFHNRFIALASAFLFLLHPIHSMSIFWISGRTDMVCSLFFLSALILFIHYYNTRAPKYYLLSQFAFLLAILSKEMAFSLPLLVMGYVLIFDESQFKVRLRESFRLGFGYILILLLIILFRFVFIPDAVLSSRDHISIAPLQLLKNFSIYLGLLAIPGGHIEISNFLKANPVIFFLLSGAALAALIVFTVWMRKSKPLLFLIVFILVTLIPVLRLMMRWYLYIPSAGFCIALAYILQRTDYSKIGKLKLSYIFAAFIFSIYAFFILNEQDRWINAGRVSKEISAKIARTIAENKLEKCYFLNAPGELQEVPVMIYGMEALINFRLRHDFGYARKVEITPICLISLRKKADYNDQVIGKIGKRQYTISLELTDSFFIFPLHREILSHKSKMEKGLVVEDAGFIRKIENVNALDEANKISVEIEDPAIPVLYYLNGNIFMNGRASGGNNPAL